MQYINATLFVIGGIIFLYLGAETIIKGGVSLGRRLKISSLLIGLTVIALGTSLPEAVVSLLAQVQAQKSSMAIGNILGSNVANIGLILGLCACFFPIKINKNLFKRDIPFMLIITLIYSWVLFKGSVSRLEGIGMLMTLVFYTTWVFFLERKNKDEPSEDAISKSISHDLFYIVIGIIGLVLGGYLLVEGGVLWAQFLGISDRVIGFTVLAIGTSFPELVTVFVALYKNKGDLALGNIVGSNIFNLLFITGSVAWVRPLSFDSLVVTQDIPFLIFLSFLLLLLTFKQRCIGRIKGFILFLLYAIYLEQLFT